MVAYIDVDYIKANGPFPPVVVDQIVTDMGSLVPIIEGRSAYIDIRLSKRYSTPFADPYPDGVRQWCLHLVAEVMLTRRGANSDSDLLAAVKASADTARAELKEAADAESGLFDLPMRQILPVQSGIVRSGPLGYSEPSPYDFMDAQSEALNGR